MLRLTERYPQRRAFVTGAASGFGLALCLRLAADGWTLGMADISEEALPAAAAAVRAAGGQALPIPLDVRDAVAFRAAVEDFAGKTGGLDVGINNAGIAGAGLFETIAPEDWRAVLEVDLMGVVHGCRAFIPPMRQAGTGHLLNVASIAAVAAAPRMAPYNAAKAGVLALSETLYGELKDSGIHVGIIMPAFFQTNIAAGMRGGPDDRALTERLLKRSDLTADEVAAEALRQAGKDAIHILYPRQSKFIWHFKRLLPATYVKRLVRVTRSTTRYIEEKLRRNGGAA